MITFFIGVFCGATLGVFAMGFIYGLHRSIFDVAQDIKEFCEEHDCYDCPARKKHTCRFDAECPIGWDIDECNKL